MNILDGFVPESAPAMADERSASESRADAIRREAKERIHAVLAPLPRGDRHTVLLDVLADFILQGGK